MGDEGDRSAPGARPRARARARVVVVAVPLLAALPWWLGELVARSWGGAKSGAVLTIGLATVVGVLTSLIALVVAPPWRGRAALGLLGLAAGAPWLAGWALSELPLKYALLVLWLVVLAVLACMASGAKAGTRNEGDVVWPAAMTTVLITMAAALAFREYAALQGIGWLEGRELASAIRAHAAEVREARGVLALGLLPVATPIALWARRSAGRWRAPAIIAATPVAVALLVVGLDAAALDAYRAQQLREADVDDFLELPRFEPFGARASRAPCFVARERPRADLVAHLEGVEAPHGRTPPGTELAGSWDQLGATIDRARALASHARPSPQSIVRWPRPALVVWVDRRLPLSRLGQLVVESRQRGYPSLVLLGKNRLVCPLRVDLRPPIGTDIRVVLELLPGGVVLADTAGARLEIPDVDGTLDADSLRVRLAERLRMEPDRRDVVVALPGAPREEVAARPWPAILAVVAAARSAGFEDVLVDRLDADRWRR